MGTKPSTSGPVDRLVERLRRHIEQMAPHQRNREQGRLLTEALAELERLQTEAEHRAKPSGSA